jgi:hypothetical protein
MPDFVGQMGTQVQPFGVNEFLRSWQDVKTESYTLDMNSIPPSYRDGNPWQKEARAGTLMAKATSGGGAGKIGPYCATAGTAEVQLLTPGGTWSAGTFTLTRDGFTTPPLPYNATAAQIQAALNALPSALGLNPLVVTGGPISTSVVTLTAQAGTVGNIAQVTADISLVTGSSPTIAPSTSVAGVAGVNDGRQTGTNIVGILLTSVPWQLGERDVEVSVVYEASVVQGWCLEMAASGLLVPLSNAAAAFCIKSANNYSVDLSFH